MKKSAQKIQPPPTLGTKRNCPKCSTKFYDFGKEELTCPKCSSVFNVGELKAMPTPVAELKRPAKAEKVGEDPLVQSDEPASEFESVDDLADDDDDVVEVETDEEDSE